MDNNVLCSFCYMKSSIVSPIGKSPPYVTVQCLFPFIFPLIIILIIDIMLIIIVIINFKSVPLTNLVDTLNLLVLIVRSHADCNLYIMQII